MTDTATPETGPVDAPASIESIVAELETGGGEAPASDLDQITQELVNEAEGDGGDSDEEPATEDDATDPADEAEEPEEGHPDEQTYTVKVNGEERQVPLSELLKGYSRTEDYKAKTAAVAEARREAESVRDNAEAAAKAHYASQLEQATAAFAEFDPVLQEARKINWEQLKATDPTAFIAMQDAVNVRLQQLDAMKQKVATARQEADQHRQQQEQQERASRFDQAAEKIVEAMPELADEAKFSAFAADSIGYLRNEGFSPEEIADALDHRVLTLADKARRWDAQVAAQKSLPDKKVVPKSSVKALTTDGTGSRSQPSRFPARASRESKVDWVTDQILSEL
jgi:hypothetical protein